MASVNEIGNIRHSLAHLLAAAVLELWPTAKNTIGPAIENGFYYDFDFGSEKISDADLPKIEKKMREIYKSWREFGYKEVREAEAREIYKDNSYKLELLNDIKSRNEKITLYTSGAFTDLCRGGHVDEMRSIAIDSFKLSHIAGAYWKGDASRPMLTRIYGLAFHKKEELQKYETQLEEAKKRDHKKLGRELGLFTLSPLVGSGLPLMQPKGMIIRKAIEDFLWDLHRKRGYSRVWTPHIAKEELYVTSGHAAKFGDELFRVQGKEEKFIMKPMNCPHHMQIFADNQWSYRDLPVRYFEHATVYRDEKSGQLGGLTRVRAITQDDGHLFCRVDQIKEEVSTIVQVIREFYDRFSLNDYWVSLSVRGEDKSKYLGAEDLWKKAEDALDDAAKANNLNYTRVVGEAAFYGPKLDFIFKDSIGREWQLATIQCDFNLPERFDLSFTNDRSGKERPVVIHRAISGSLERFMGILIEHYAGAFPYWLAPIQVAIVPVSEKHHEYANKCEVLLNDGDIRTEMFNSNDTVGKRIRLFKMQKIPYAIVIGDKEQADDTVTLENRDTGKSTVLKQDTLVDFFKNNLLK